MLLEKCMWALLTMSSGRVGCKMSWKDKCTMYECFSHIMYVVWLPILCYKYYMLSSPSFRFNIKFIIITINRLVHVYASLFTYSLVVLPHGLHNMITTCVCFII